MVMMMMMTTTRTTLLLLLTMMMMVVLLTTMWELRCRELYTDNFIGINLQIKPKVFFVYLQRLIEASLNAIAIANETSSCSTEKDQHSSDPIRLLFWR